MIQYTVSMPRPNTHYFEVRIDVTDTHTRSKDGIIHLVMPVWTPGSYLVREFSRNVLDLRVVNSDNNTELNCAKESKNKWAVELAGATSVTVNYRVYAFDFTTDTSYLDTRHGVINGASVFIYVEGTESEEIRLKVVPFSNWEKISTGLEQIESAGRGRSYNSPNYDVLIDSPIEIGNQQIYSFEVSQVNHEVSIFGTLVNQSTRLVSDLKKIVETTWPIFGEIPYKKYAFLIDSTGSSLGNGLEHLNSTHCIVPSLRTLTPQDYKTMMSLFSHEFFHAWNVKRLRPKGLGPFDYSNETYSKSLWIAEGITSYYDDLILRRAGIFSVSEYLDAFSININVIQSRPSYRFESAEESSFDSWIKHYRPDENTANTQSSYYVQGAAIGWMLDMEIRHSSSNQRNLDSVMQKMYTEIFTRNNRGYSEEEFEEACQIASGNRTTEIFDKHVRGRQKFDFQHFLDYAGLNLGPRSPSLEVSGYLGIKLKSDNGRAIVDSKLFDTPAEASGLASGDEIIALDNLRMDTGMIPHYVSNKKPGEVIKILISRDGTIDTIEAKLVEAPILESRIYKDDSATLEQKIFFRDWLNSDWDQPLEYHEYSPSPQNPRLFAYV